MSDLPKTKTKTLKYKHIIKKSSIIEFVDNYESLKKRTFIPYSQLFEDGKLCIRLNDQYEYDELAARWPHFRRRNPEYLHNEYGEFSGKYHPDFPVVKVNHCLDKDGKPISYFGNSCVPDLPPREGSIEEFFKREHHVRGQMHIHTYDEHAKGVDKGRFVEGYFAIRPDLSIRYDYFIGDTPTPLFIEDFILMTADHEGHSYDLEIREASPKYITSARSFINLDGDMEVHLYHPQIDDLN